MVKPQILLEGGITLITYLFVALALATGVAVGYYACKSVTATTIGTAQDNADRIIRDARRDAEAQTKEILFNAKEESLHYKELIDSENRKRQNELTKIENRLNQREITLENKSEQIEKQLQKIDRKYKDLDRKRSQVDKLYNKRVSELERISELTHEEAKELLMEEVEKESLSEAAALAKRIENEARDTAEKEASNIIAHAIQRTAASNVSENTITVVNLPNDEMKGRIIGREGRNIRSLEAATGIELIIDDTPEAVILSGFDPVRREVARLALEKLILDGRIHPGRIEDTVKKAKKEVESQIREEGEQASYDVGIHNLHGELIKLLGRLKYRTSYGQNVLKHSVEVSLLAGNMAAELGGNVKVAKRAGLLHDIGKAIDHEVEGNHVDIGVNLLKKYREKNDVIHAVQAHHGDIEATTLEAVLVQAADTISAARPGARNESLVSYVQRLEDLENIANSFEGVEKSYAIQAGREIRVIVKPDIVDDDRMYMLSKDIAKKIEDQLDYPGNIKINLIRETRQIEYAK